MEVDMDVKQFRGFLAVVIGVVLVAGLYLGWHLTHPAHHCTPYGGSGQPWHSC
jgi:hypothetical protein